MSDLYTYNKNKDVLDFDLDTKSPRTPERAFRKVCKVAGDYVFNCPTIKFANEYAQVHHGRSFFYKFNRRSRAVQWPEWFGVSHGFEIDFVFGTPWQAHDAYDPEDRLVSRKVMNVWANFAKHGKLYCHYDAIRSRDYFIEFNAGVGADDLNQTAASVPTEQDEFALFNKYYENCDLFNELNNKRSYANKYEECLKYKVKLSLPISSASNTPQRATHLYTYIFSVFFFYFSIRYV
jgi:hypothetical protein